jgi:hypothetical protein
MKTTRDPDRNVLFSFRVADTETRLIPRAATAARKSRELQFRFLFMFLVLISDRPIPDEACYY